MKEEELLQSPELMELCESRGGRPGLPVPNSPYGLCGRKATLNSNRRLYSLDVQEVLVS